jgi:hypothetical protein
MATAINESAPAKVANAGDIVFADGANSIDNLAIGSPRYVLKVNAAGNAPEWGSFGAVCTLSKLTQNISTGVDTTPDLDYTLFDTDSMADLANDRILIPSGFDGYYLVIANWSWNPGSGARSVKIYRELSGGSQSYVEHKTNDAEVGIASLMAIFDVDGGGHFRLRVRQDSGGTLALGSLRLSAAMLFKL